MNIQIIIPPSYLLYILFVIGFISGVIITILDFWISTNFWLRLFGKGKK